MWAVMLTAIGLTATGVTPWRIIPAAVAAGLVGSSALLASGMVSFLAVMVMLVVFGRRSSLPAALGLPYERGAR